MNPETIIVQPYSKGELCNLYKIRYRTFAIWLKPFTEKIGEYTGGKYTVKQVRLIFDALGEP